MSCVRFADGCRQLFEIVQSFGSLRTVKRYAYGALQTIDVLCVNIVRTVSYRLPPPDPPCAYAREGFTLDATRKFKISARIHRHRQRTRRPAIHRHDVNAQHIGKRTAGHARRCQRRKKLGKGHLLASSRLKRGNWSAMIRKSRTVSATV